VILSQVLHEEGAFEEGLAQLRGAISVSPTDKIAQGLLGTRLQQAGEFKEAEECFRRAIDLDPTDAGPYFGIVRGRRIGEEDRPLIEQMLAVLGRTSHPEAQALLNYSLGKAYQDLGEFKAAMRFFDEANRIKASRHAPFEQQKYRAHFDSIIRTFTPEFMEKHASLGLQTDLPVFIVGMIRSGTTLVEQILSSHPQVGAGGEQSYWLEDRLQAFKDALSGKFQPEAAQKFAIDYQTLLEALAPDKKRVTDKMPTNYLALGLIHLLYPNARIVCCHREPVDNCLSIYTTAYVQGSPGYAHSRENIVFAYREYERLMNHWKQVLPADRLMEVLYEDMVDDAENVTRRLVDFVGLEWDDACLGHDKTKGVVKTPSLWQARQPIYRSSLERWRNYEPWLGTFRDLIPDREIRIGQNHSV
jgi:tetratricopeptide (TPR) repeat protein